MDLDSGRPDHASRSILSFSFFSLCCPLFFLHRRPFILTSIGLHRSESVNRLIPSDKEKKKGKDPSRMIHRRGAKERTGL